MAHTTHHTGGRKGCTRVFSLASLFSLHFSRVRSDELCLRDRKRTCFSVTKRSVQEFLLQNRRYRFPLAGAAKGERKPGFRGRRAEGQSVGAAARNAIFVLAHVNKNNKHRTTALVRRDTPLRRRGRHHHPPLSPSAGARCVKTASACGGWSDYFCYYFDNSRRIIVILPLALFTPGADHPSLIIRERHPPPPPPPAPPGVGMIRKRMTFRRDGHLTKVEYRSTAFRWPTTTLATR